MKNLMSTGVVFVTALLLSLQVQAGMSDYEYGGYISIAYEPQTTVTESVSTNGVDIGYEYGGYLSIADELQITITDSVSTKDVELDGEFGGYLE